MAEPATQKKTSSMILDLTKLPGEILELINGNLDSCFDVVHARSVCRSWRSTFPLPSCLLRPSYSLPTYPVEKIGLNSLERIPLFLFRVRTPVYAAVASNSEYFLGGIGRDESGDYMELTSPLQCSLRVKLSRSDSRLVNIRDCQIFSLGHQYRMICWDPKGLRTCHKIAAFLPLNKEGREGEFVVLRGCMGLLVLTSAERKWKRLMDGCACTGLVTFRGRFFAVIRSRGVFVIDPYSLEITPLMPSKQLNGSNYLIPSGDDELFLVERTVPSVGRATCRVSRLDEEAGGWVDATDLGDRVLFVGQDANVCCLAEQLPDGCGVTGDSVLFTNQLKEVTSFYKYQLPTGAAEGIGSDWRISKESRVKFIKSKSPALAFQVER